MITLSFDREYSRDAAEVWGKECTEQQKLGYLVRALSSSGSMRRISNLTTMVEVSDLSQTRK